MLVSDIAMPDEDGYMLVRKVRQLPESEGGRTRAIAVTAFASRSDKARALEAGFDAHIPKPIDLDALVGQLADLMPLVDGAAEQTSGVDVVGTSRAPITNPGIPEPALDEPVDEAG